MKINLNIMELIKLKGDWVAYQRYLHSVPPTQESEFMRRVDAVVKSAKVSSLRKENNNYG